MWIAMLCIRHYGNKVTEKMATKKTAIWVPSMTISSFCLWLHYCQPSQKTVSGSTTRTTTMQCNASFISCGLRTVHIVRLRLWFIHDNSWHFQEKVSLSESLYMNTLRWYYNRTMWTTLNTCKDFNTSKKTSHRCSLFAECERALSRFTLYKRSDTKSKRNIIVQQSLILMRQLKYVCLN